MASSSAPPPPPNPGPGHVIPDNAIFVTDKCYCRPYLETDAEPSALLADDPAIARWMREAFPQPYTTADAAQWIASSLAQTPMLNFAVVALDGTLVGGIVCALGRPCPGRCTCGSPIPTQPPSPSPPSHQE